MDIKLGEDLMNQAGLTQLQPEDTTMSILKFDARGSVHVMCRDDEEKLLKDLTVKDMVQTSTVFEQNDDYTEELEAIRKSNRKVSIIASVVIIVLILLVLGSIAMLQFRAGGL